MFSYRHAFHAGNHADVLKHLCLIATLDHLQQKPTPLTLVDTHAGAGSYTLAGQQARTSGEADAGVMRLLQALADLPEDQALPAALQRYIDVLASFNGDSWQTYPGSPRILQSLMRPEAGDRLRLFELHPTDSRLLRNAMGDAPNVQILVKDSFEGLKAMVPPPAGPGGSKRALVLMDPSYELKTDYGRVAQTIQDALKRFATGCYLIWYPVIARPEAHQLPRRLKTLANQAERPWLHATLSVGRDSADTRGLTASGMFIINPPHVLADQLREAQPVLMKALGQGKGQAMQVETS